MESFAFEPPRQIKINEFIYSYKDELIKNNYSYRCQKRTLCKISIKVSKEELEKYIKDNSYIIQYTITSTEKNHKCTDTNINEIKNKSENIEKNASNIIKMYKDKAKDLIFLNITKPLSFHISNIRNNNIKLTTNQIKRLVQKIREVNFPSDSDFLKDISKITINFENEVGIENLNFCWKNVELINPTIKYKTEKYIIFTSIFQINLITKCNQIFIDGTFKSAPKKFYQILNICGYYKDIKGIIPIFMVLLTGKSEYLYDAIFIDIKKIMKDNGINVENIPKKFMLDFEKGLMNAVKKNFDDVKIDGCYFHFLKLLWTKAKNLGLCKVNKLKRTKILIFMLKIIPFIEIDDREMFFKRIEEYYSLHKEGYEKMVSYYKKNWLRNHYIDYIYLDNEEYICRTNKHNIHLYIKQIINF